MKSANDLGFQCKTYMFWNDLFNFRGHAVNIALDWLAFVVCGTGCFFCRAAVILFFKQGLAGMAACAAWLVTVFAPYAAQTGIPELKVVMGKTESIK